MSSLRLTWLLLALNLLVLFWALSVYQHQYQDEITATSQTGKPVELPDFPVFMPQTAEEYADITERPLFNEQRLPSEKEEVVIEKVSKNRDNGSSLKLVGVALLPEGSRALILKPDRKVEKVSPGEKIDGWELLSIDDESVLLEQSGQQVRLELDRKSQNVPGIKRRLPSVRKK